MDWFFYAVALPFTLLFLVSAVYALQWAVKNGQFDLVLLDWMMPGLSGLDVLKQLRAGSLTSAVQRAGGRLHIRRISPS